MIIKYLSILVLLFFACLVCAQNNDIKFKGYTVDDGLSQSRVQDIIQDELGYIWVASQGGLDKFDGYEFQAFRAKEEDESSLAHNDVRTLFEDSKGRLWVGAASDGVVQYFDRKQQNFVTYSLFPDDDENAKDVHIHDICEDENGTIWLAAHTKGVFRINLNSSEPMVKPFAIDKPSNENREFSVISLVKDSHGNLWMGGTGLHFYNTHTDTIISFYNDASNKNSIGSNTIIKIYEDSNQTLWVLTDNGLNALPLDSLERYSQNKSNFLKIHPDKYNVKKLIQEDIVSISEDKDGNLWIGSFSGLYKLFQNSIYKENGELDVLNPVFHHYTNDPLDKESLNFNNVRVVYCDNTGIVWVGTSAGLNQSKNEKFRHYHQGFTNKGLSNNKIEAILGDSNNNIWICNVKGVDLFDREKIEFSNVLPGPVLCAAEGEDGLIYFGTWNAGVIEFNPKTRQSKLYQNNPKDKNSISKNSIFSLLKDSDQNLWIGTWSGGLNLFNRQNNKFIRYSHKNYDKLSLIDNHINTLFEDSRKNIWVGTLNGLSLLTNKQKGRFKNYESNSTEKGALKHNDITCIYESKDSTLWIGTMGGLHRYDYERDSFTRYSVDNGLPDDRIMGILEDDKGNLWISTRNGLSRITFLGIEKDPNELRIRTFNIDDGLQSREFVRGSCFKSNDGTLFFGGINGFNLFDPKVVPENILPPPVYITSLSLFNEKVSIGQKINNQIVLTKAISEIEEIELSYKNNIFSFQFTGLNYSAPQQTKYAYMLEGFDNSWNYSETLRIASYTNLDPGEYTFKVKASSYQDIWNEEGQAIKLIITPPFWKTWWFRLLLFFLLLIVTVALIELRLYSIKRQKKLLELKVARRTNRIVQQKEEIEKQAKKIEKMNYLLKKYNIELEENVHHLEEARVMQKLLSFEEYKKLYPSDFDCLKLIETLKWQKGYKCRKCDGKEYSKDNVTLSRRCKNCNYKESVTAWTIFHRLRFHLDKALYILILTNTGQSLNISKLADSLNLRMKTCWDFHKKVKKVINENKQQSLKRKKDWKDIIVLHESKISKK